SWSVLEARRCKRCLASRTALPARAAAGFPTTPGGAKSGRWRRSIRRFCCAARYRSGSRGGIFWRSRKRWQVAAVSRLVHGGIEPIEADVASTVRSHDAACLHCSRSMMARAEEGIRAGKWRGSDDRLGRLEEDGSSQQASWYVGGGKI